MTISNKQLLRKMSSRISASAFLDAYKVHIAESYPESHTVLSQYNAGQLLPTPTLEALKQVIQTHITLNLQKKNKNLIEKFEEKKDKPAKKSDGISGNGRYFCRFFVKVPSERNYDEVIQYINEDGYHTFCKDLYQDASRFIDRHQNEMENAIYATITSIENGKELTTVIPRSDSVARVMQKRGGPASRNRGIGLSKSMASYMRAKNDTCSFSRG